MSQLVRKIYPKIGPRRLVIFGLTAGAMVTCSLLLATSASSSLWTYRAVLFGRGMCSAFVFIPLQAAAFATITRSIPAGLRRSFLPQRQVASSLGIAVLISILAAQLASAQSHLFPSAAHGTVLDALYDSLQDPLLWCAAFALIGSGGGVVDRRPPRSRGAAARCWSGPRECGLAEGRNFQPESA
jgi:MFS family permease